jgi:hypothetical protein
MTHSFLQRVIQQTESHENAPVFQLDLAVPVCDNVNMKPRIAAICAIVTFATCVDGAPDQFPDCAYITVFNPCPVSSETRGDCEPIIDPQVACQDCPSGAGAWWVVNNRKDGEANVTIRVTLWDRVLGTDTFTDQALTLAPGERRPLGCSLPGSQPQYTWSVQDCQPHSEQVFAGEQLTPAEKKFADAQDAFVDHVGQLWNANLESNYRQLIPGTVSVELSTSPEGELVETSVLSNTSNELAAQLIIDAIRPAIRFLATGKSSKITAEVTAFAAEGSELNPRHRRPVANVSVSQGGLGYPYATSASFSVHDLSELNGLGPK